MASYLMSLSPFKAFASASADGEASTSSSSSSSSAAAPAASPSAPRSGRRHMKRDRPSPLPASFHGGTSHDARTSSSPVRAGKRRDKGRMLVPEEEDRGEGASGGGNNEADTDIEDVGEPWDKGPKMDMLRHLPHEVALLILLHLPTHDSLVSLSSVSRFHRTLVNDPLLWREFFYRNPGWTLRGDEEWIEGLLTDMPGAKDLLLPLDNGEADDSVCSSLDDSGIDPDTSTSSRILPSTWGSRTHGTRLRRIDRLNWRVLYSLRFYLASRVGQVHSRWGYAKDPPVQHPSWNEDFSDDDRSASSEDGSSGGSSSELSSVTDSEDDDSDEASFRREAEAESQASQLSKRFSSLNTPTKGQGRRRRRHRRRSPTFAPELRTIGSHEDNIYCIKTFLPPKHFAPTVGYIVTGSRDATIRVWSLSTAPTASSSNPSSSPTSSSSAPAPRIGRCTHILRGGHSRSIVALDVCPKGLIMVSASSDAKLGIWNWFGCDEAVQAAREGKQWKPRLIDRWDCYATVMDVRLTEEWMCFGLREGVVRCYRRLDLVNGEPATTTKENRYKDPRDMPEESNTEAVSSSLPDGGDADADADASADVTKEQTPRPNLFERACVHKTYSSSINDLKIRGRTLACAYANGHVEVIDIPTGKILYPPAEGEAGRKRIPRLDGVACMEYGLPLMGAASPEQKAGDDAGATAAGAPSEDGEMIDAKDKEVDATILRHSVIICGSTDLSIYCYSAYSGEVIAILDGHQLMPRSLCLDQDKGLLLSVGYDGVINMWDLGRLFWDGERRMGHALGRSARGDWAKLAPSVGGMGSSASISNEGAASSSSSTTSSSSSPSTPEPLRPHPIYTSRDFVYHSFRGGPTRSDFAAANGGSSTAIPAGGYPAATATGGPYVGSPTSQWRSSNGGTPRMPCRLFGVTFDGKRVLTVGETRHIFVRELLPTGGGGGGGGGGAEGGAGSEGAMEKGVIDPSRMGREWVGWELFA